MLHGTTGLGALDGVTALSVLCGRLTLDGSSRALYALHTTRYDSSRPTAAFLSLLHQSTVYYVLLIRLSAAAAAAALPAAWLLLPFTAATRLSLSSFVGETKSSPRAASKPAFPSPRWCSRSAYHSLAATLIEAQVMATKKVTGTKLGWAEFSGGNDDFMSQLPSAPDPNREARRGIRGDRGDRMRRDGGYGRGKISFTRAVMASS